MAISCEAYQENKKSIQAVYSRSKTNEDIVKLEITRTRYTNILIALSHLILFVG
jgi:hypothetical protein